MPIIRYENKIIPIFENIKKYVSDVTPIILELTKKSNIIFEGAQATMLDIDHGTYPYVTSSNTTYPGLKGPKFPIILRCLEFL